MESIITITINPTIDMYTQVDRLKPNTKLRGDESMLSPGGGGVNVSRAVARLGGRSIMIYTYGGYTGELFKHMLKDEVKDQHWPVFINGSTRLNSIVREKETNNLYRFGAPGDPLDSSIKEKLLDTIDQAMENGGYCIASGSLPPGLPDDFYAQVSKLAAKHDVKFILDTSGKQFEQALQAGAYCIKPNEDEIKYISDEPTGNIGEQKAVLLGVLKKYPVENIVLSLGSRGALLARQGHVQHFAAAPIKKKKSAVGAGDSMVGGIVYMLAQGKTIQQAVQFGIACGSAALLTHGTELFKKDDVFNLYDQHVSTEAN